METLVALLKQLSEYTTIVNKEYAVELDITLSCSEKAFEIIYGELRKQYDAGKGDPDPGYTPLYTNLIIDHNRLLDEKQKELH